MSIVGKIKTLFSDKENTEALFPRTKVKAVSDDDGVGLNIILDDIRSKIQSAPGGSATDISDATVDGKPLVELLNELTSPLRFMPVGYIYVSSDPTSPAELFGGTWEALTDRVIVGAGGKYAVGSTGGAETHTLTVNEMPNHEGHLYGTAGKVNGKGDAVGAWLQEITTSSSLSISFGWDYSNNEYYPTNRPLGGGKAHNNMQPYIAKYIWERVA